MDDLLKLRRIDPTYHLVFDDGSQLSLTSDMDDMRYQLEAIEPGAFDAFRRYLDEGRRHYEVGTEKLQQIRLNPNSRAVHFAGWTLAEGGAKLWRSAQINGTAEVIPSSDPRFSVAVDKYNLVRVTKERSVRRFDLIRIQPEQIYYFDTTLGEGYAVYQRWLRGRTGVVTD